LTGRSVKYVPEAVVYHKVHGERVKLNSLLKRAFGQGYTKAYIKKAYKGVDALSIERDYMKLLLKSSLKRLKHMIFGPERREAIKHLAFIVMATSTVLIGFISGLLRAKI
jgi:hypothetical protein